MPQPSVCSSEVGLTVTLVDTDEPAATESDEEPVLTLTVPKLK